MTEKRRCRRVLHCVKDMGSEMFELCDTSHYFVFRLVGLTLINLENTTKQMTTTNNPQRRKPLKNIA